MILRLYGIWQFSPWLADYAPRGFYRDRALAAGMVEAGNSSGDVTALNRFHLVETSILGAGLAGLRAALRAAKLAWWGH